MSNIFNRKGKGKLDPRLPPERRVMGKEPVVLQPGAALCWGGDRERRPWPTEFPPGPEGPGP